MTTHIPLVHISAGFGDALQALADDGHHMLLRVGEQNVALPQLPHPPLVQILQFLKNTQQRQELYNLYLNIINNKFYLLLLCI